MSNTKTFYIGGGQTDTSVTALFTKTGVFKPVEDIKKAEFIIWTGGSDINPQLYNSKPLEPNTTFNNKRDKTELSEFEKREPHQKFIGICRGFQMLNIVHGGQLYQHCNNHSGGNHEIYYRTRSSGRQRTFITNSVHHQMIIPAPRATVVARAEQATYVQRHQKIRQPIPTDALDPEIAWFRALGFGVQFHPEWGESSAEAFWYAINDWHASNHGETLI